MDVARGLAEAVQSVEALKVDYRATLLPRLAVPMARWLSPKGARRGMLCSPGCVAEIRRCHRRGMALSSGSKLPW
jgi:hypothetical protein